MVARQFCYQHSYIYLVGRKRAEKEINFMKWFRCNRKYEYNAGKWEIEKITYIVFEKEKNLKLKNLKTPP